MISARGRDVEANSTGAAVEKTLATPVTVRNIDTVAPGDQNFQRALSLKIRGDGIGFADAASMPPVASGFR
jgi:hypothetical protein